MRGRKARLHPLDLDALEGDRGPGERMDAGADVMHEARERQCRRADAAARLVRGLPDLDVQPRSRQLERSREPVRPGADDNGLLQAYLVSGSRAGGGSSSHSVLRSKPRTAYHSDQITRAMMNGIPVTNWIATKPPMLPVQRTSMRIPLRASRYTPQTTDSKPKTLRYVRDCFTKSGNGYQASANTPMSGRPI